MQGKRLEIIKLYLCRRKIAVDVDRKLSCSEGFRDISVPQSSVLRLLLFFIYTNDLPQSLQENISLVILFADDTAISFLIYLFL